MKLSTAIIFAGFLLIFATIPTVWAAEGDILTSDNFSDGNLDGWTIQYGNWYVNPQGNLAGSNSGRMLGGRINTGNSEWDNYQIDLDIDGFQGIDSGVGFRYTPNGNSYELSLRFGTGSYNTPEAILKKTENGVTAIIGDNHFLTLIGQKWYHLTIKVSNENIKIWINDGLINNLIFDITDTGTKVKKGILTLDYWTGDIGVAYMKFDNIVVTALAPPPPPRLPVIFIPGIGGSELKAAQDIFWSSADGHGGVYSHAYSANEKVWVNQDEAIKLGDDDYFDVLKLKSDGITPESALSLTNNLTPFGYSDLDSFFSGMGYVKGVNFFVSPYDWRKDIRSTKDDLDSLIETAKQKSGQLKVNLVVHSMGGLVARYYISDSVRAAKVNKLIELGVPHLGAPSAVKTLMYGFGLQKNVFGIFPVGIPASEIKDVSQNAPSFFQLLPSAQYFNFYDNSVDNPFPFFDNRDIDNNQIIGSLNYTQTKDLLANLNYNMIVFNFGEQLHNSLDSTLSQTNGVNTYEIVGTAQPTLGQIQETWLIDWPIKLIPKTDEIYVNGDDTVPIFSASLKSDHLDLSGLSKIYYVEQKHGDLVNNSGPAMQTVKSILNNDNALPVEVKDQKIALEGQHISVNQDANLDIYDDTGRHTGLNAGGSIEANIPNTFYDSLGDTKHIFVKKSSAKVTAKITSTKNTAVNVKIRHYSEDAIVKTIFYKNVPVTDSSAVQFAIDPAAQTSPTLFTNTQIIPATYEATGSAVLDQTAPAAFIQISGAKNSFGIYTGPVAATLTAADLETGILRIEYSLDQGQTVQTYSGPFVISAPGKTTIQFRSIDKAGNEEIPQTTIIEIALPPTPSPTPGPSSTTTPTPTPTPTANPAPAPQSSSVPSPTPMPGPGSTPNPVKTLISSADIVSKISPRKSAFEIISSRQSLISPLPTVIAGQAPALSDSDKMSEESNGRQSNPILTKPEVLGVNSQNPSPIPKKLTSLSSEQSFSGLLIVLGGVIILISGSLSIAFFNQIPKKMNNKEPKNYIN